MKFRPCIDIHNGKVKQIVGGSLNDEGDHAKENFASSKDASYYAEMYKNDGTKSNEERFWDFFGKIYYMS
mgnify:CR=1 FL=1